MSDDPEMSSMIALQRSQAINRNGSRYGIGIIGSFKISSTARNAAIMRKIFTRLLR